MTRRRCLLFALLALVLFPGVSQASPLDVGGSVGSWQALPNLSTTPLNSGAFWNNTSSDNGKSTNLNQALNIGYYLTGQGGFSGSPSSPAIPAGNLKYWGTGSGTADLSEYFTSPSPQVSMTVTLTLAGNAGSNVLGYYDATGVHPFGVVSPGQTIAFTVSNPFGFYLDASATGNGIFASDAALAQSLGLTAFYNSLSDTPTVGSPGFQHFAVFQQSDGTLWVGVEDLPSGSTDADFNDVVFSVQATPLPSSLILGLTGVAAWGSWGWRRRRVIAA